MSKEELVATHKMLEELKTQCRDMLRQAKRIDLEREIRGLNTQIGISADQINLGRKSNRRPAKPMRSAARPSRRKC